MPISAVIFDLDGTLLNTRSLQGLRDARRWGECLQHLDHAEEFTVPDGDVAVVALPAQAAARGLAVGLLTSSPARYAEALMTMFGIKVEAMITHSDGYAAKPNPSGLEAVAAQLGVGPSDCVYVGDAADDFRAAAAAGMASVGVAWNGRYPREWRKAWPDVAAERTGVLLDFVDGTPGLPPLGEVIAGGCAPTLHGGSLMRLGDQMYALGRYFTSTDKRESQHDLSQLVLAAKEGVDASQTVGDIFETLASRMTSRQPQVVMSVPPRPGQDYDRFAGIRARLSTTWGARDGGGLLRMEFAVDEYVHVSAEDRPALNAGRFVAEPLDGETVVLIDDVLTSGGQAEACRAALRDAGAGPVFFVALAVTQERLPELCPTCNGLMKTFTGSWGRFRGCTNYWTTGCRYKYNL